MDDYPKALLADADEWRFMAATLKRGAQILQARSKAAQTALLTLSDPGTSTAASEDKRRALAEEEALFRVSQMLYQLSIENSLKGLIVFRGKPAPRKHKLLILAADADLSLDPSEKRWLTMLDRMNELGRYKVAGSEKNGFTTGAIAFNNLEAMLRTIEQKIASAFSQ